jgi:hypothetical protein
VDISSSTQETDEQFISSAPKIPGYQKTLNIFGQPAVKTNWQYYIKLTNGRQLILSAFNNENNQLDTIVSTIKVTNQ